MFKRAAGIDLTYVPYGGGTPAANALLGGHVTVVLQNYSELMEHVRAGKLRVLAVTTRTRLDDLPDVPTVSESGYAGYEVAAWFGLVAPAKTPKDTLDRLGQIFTAALMTPKVQTSLRTLGMRTVGLGGAEFGTFIRRQNEVYARVIREANIKGQ
jgi:tripartite-type tricarboxylate transporter receptor subunit TctC